MMHSTSNDWSDDLNAIGEMLEEDTQPEEQCLHGCDGALPLPFTLSPSSGRGISPCDDGSWIE